MKTMDIRFDYNPKTAGSFADGNALRAWTNEQMRTDITQKWTCPLTRGNIYFLRGDDGRLQHFFNAQNIGQRQQLKQLITDALRVVPVEGLRHDVIDIKGTIAREEMLEAFSELVEVLIPAWWNTHASQKQDSTLYLDSSVAFILHTDESYDGEVLHLHIHRLYVTNPELLKR